MTEYASTFGKIIGNTLYISTHNGDSNGYTICSFESNEEAKDFKKWLYEKKIYISGNLKEKIQKMKELKKEFSK